MSFSPSDNLKQEVAELLTHYPEGEQRSASLMVLHAIQSEAGYISKEAMQWAAGEIGIPAEPLRAGHLLSDAARGAAGQVCVESVPHTQLRIGRRHGSA